MTPQKILEQAPHVLTRRQREEYFEKGFVCVPELVPADGLMADVAADRYIGRCQALHAASTANP